MNSEEEPPNKKRKSSESVSQLETVNEGLNKYLSTISSTLSDSFKQMSSNVTNNLKAVQTMSSMLEKAMLYSYRCKMCIVSDPLTMKLVISPTSFPLNNGKLKIVVINANTKEQIENSLNKEISINLEDLSQSFKLSEEIKLKHPQQCNVIVNLSIPSPSTKLPLQIQYTTGIYILQQCKYLAFDNISDEIVFSEEILVNGLFLLDLMKVKPTEKMSQFYVALIEGKRISVFEIKPCDCNKCSLMIAKMKVDGIDEVLLKNELIRLDEAFTSLNYLF